MSAVGPQTGSKMKLYRNTGSAGTPVWVLVDEVGDVSIPDLSRGIAELARRAKDFKKGVAGIIQMIAIEFRLFHGLGWTNFTAIQGNFFNGTAEQWAVMDQAIASSGAQGLKIPVLVENFPWDQPLEDVSGHDVRLVAAYWESPAGTEIDPAWMTVA